MIDMFSLRQRPSGLFIVALLVGVYMHVCSRGQQKENERALGYKIWWPQSQRKVDLHTAYKGWTTERGWSLCIWLQCFDFSWRHSSLLKGCAIFWGLLELWRIILVSAEVCHVAHTLRHVDSWITWVRRGQRGVPVISLIDGWKQA